MKLEVGKKYIDEYKEPRKFEFWVNVYENGYKRVADDYEESRNFESEDCVARIKVTGVEGQYDQD